MLDLSHDWDPNEWEDYVYGLLQDRHGVLNVDKVPAQHKGDFGIDYYCKNLCVVYQCYVVQEPVSTADRAKKQKGKITTDLKKFCSDGLDLKAIIGPIKISHWVLVVPRHTSAQVNAHLTLKTKNVLAKNLDYVAPNFKVSIHALDSFHSSSRQKHIENLNEISIPIKEVTDQNVLDWRATTAGVLLDNLTAKLNKKISSPLDINFYIKLFLEKQNAIEYLRDSAPQLYETVNTALNRKLMELQFAGPHTSGDANSVLRDEVGSLVSLLTNQINNLAPASADSIVYGTLSEWLMRCPLDFPPYQS